MFYAKLENTGISIDVDEVDRYGYENIKRYFNEYHKGDSTAFVFYEFDKTSTGRLSSSFHPFQKNKFGSIIKSKFKDGELMCVDWQCFEFKVLLHRLQIECKEADPYQYIADKINYDREKTKNNIIKYMYGSVLVDDVVIDELEKRFALKSKLILEKERLINNRTVKTSYNKTIQFKTESDAQSKSINNITQSDASFLITSLVCKLIWFLEEFKYESKVIATVYDEIILDAKEKEVDSLCNIFKYFSEEDPMLKSNYVVFTPSIKIGKNLREFETWQQ